MPPVCLAQQNGFGPGPNKTVSRLWCSVCGPAHENQMNKKSKHARRFGSAKMVLAQNFPVQDTMRLVNGHKQTLLRVSPAMVLSMWPNK